MNYWWILLLLFLWWEAWKRRKRAAIVSGRLHRRKGKEVCKAMEELATKFIGKDCLIYTVASESISVKGTVMEVKDGWLVVEEDGNQQIVNMEYVTRIREWPRNAKGKKKSVFS